jgi:ribosomal protein S27E
MTDNGTDATNGSRVRCNTCGSEAIVTSANGSALTCCGQPVEITFAGGR